jgi:hypothetical protein
MGIKSPNIVSQSLWTSRADYGILFGMLPVADVDTVILKNPQHITMFHFVKRG